MALKKGIDWDSIRQEYVTSLKSAKKIADEHGIVPGHVSRRCAEGGWVAQRKAFRKSVADKAIKKAEKKEIDRLANLISAADTAGSVAALGLKRAEKAWKELATCAPEDKAEVIGYTDSRTARDYTAIIKEVIAIMRDYYDIPTAAEREARELAKERVKIERERMERGSSTGVGAFEHGVCLIPAIMETPKPPSEPLSTGEHGENGGEQGLSTK